MKYLNTKNIVIALVLFLVVLVAVVFYRMFLQFNSKDVAIYIDEEAKKYPGSEKEVYALIRDGVEHILSSHNYTQQVIRTAKNANIPKEMELVNAAVLQCKAFGYLETAE